MRWIPAILAVAALALVLFLRAAGKELDPCGNTVLSTSLSPAKTLVAVVYTRGCGATTGWSTNVSLLPADNPVPEGAGNVFRAEWDERVVDSLPPVVGGPGARPEWLSADRLLIVYDRRAEAWLTKRSQRRIQIRYRRANLPLPLRDRNR